MKILTLFAVLALISSACSSVEMDHEEKAPPKDAPALIYPQPTGLSGNGCQTTSECPTGLFCQAGRCR